MTGEDINVLGFREGDPARPPGEAYGIPHADRIHTAMFGSPGCGKSTVIKLLVLQNLRRGEGFMVLDPHGELAQDVLSMIPDCRMDDVVYVSPASLHRHGRTVRINPLEVRREEDRSVTVMSLVNALYNLYKDSWGPRLETVLRNAAQALVEGPNNTLSSMSGLITDQAARDVLLQGVASRSVKHFWREIFEKQYSKDAGSSAYNKLDKILSTPAIAAMLDSPESSVRMEEIIRDGRIVVVDLSAGTSDDIAAFLGTIILHLLYVEAKRRMEHGGGEAARRSTYYCYVDECHLFSTAQMAEMLRALRKFGVKMVLATQTINAYDRQFAAELTGTCSTLLCGACDPNTAQLLASKMPLGAGELGSLPQHTFAFSGHDHGVPVSGVVRSRPVPDPRQQLKKWQDVAAHSLARYGEKVNIEKYIPRHRAAVARMDPLETAILHALFFERRDMDREEIAGMMQRRFEVQAREVYEALVNTLVNQLQYVKTHNVRDDDGDGNLHTRYSVTRVASNSYLSQAAAGRRAGGEAHLRVLFDVMEHQMRQGNYCVPDLGDSDDDAADLLVMEPETYKRSSDGATLRDPHRWNEDTITAVEVETDPGKHIGQVVKNFSKNDDRGYHVWFICFSSAHRDKIVDALSGAGVDPARYVVHVVDASQIGEGRYIPDAPYLRAQDFAVGKPPAPDAKPGRGGPARQGSRNRAGAGAPGGRAGAGRRGESPARLDDLEARIYGAVGDGILYDAGAIASGLGCSESDAKAAVRGMLSKGVLYEDRTERHTRRTQLDGTGEKSTTRWVKILKRKERHRDTDADNAVCSMRQPAERYRPGGGPPAGSGGAAGGGGVDYGSLSSDTLRALLLDAGYARDRDVIMGILGDRGHDMPGADDF